MRKGPSVADRRRAVREFYKRLAQGEKTKTRIYQDLASEYRVESRTVQRWVKGSPVQLPKKRTVTFWEPLWFNGKTWAFEKHLVIEGEDIETNEVINVSDGPAADALNVQFWGKTMQIKE